MSNVMMSTSALDATHWKTRSVEASTATMSYVRSASPEAAWFCEGAKKRKKEGKGDAIETTGFGGV